MIPVTAATVLLTTAWGHVTAARTLLGGMSIAMTTFVAIAEMQRSMTDGETCAIASSLWELHLQRLSPLPHSAPIDQKIINKN